MQRLKYITIIFLFFGLWEPIHAAEKPDVRDVRWGMSKKEVQKQEKKNKLEQESLAYQTTFLQFQVALEYIFAEDKLIAVEFLPLKRQNADKHYIDYLQIATVLTKKYGKPQTHKGNTFEMMRWELSRTWIDLTFQGIWILTFQQRPQEEK